MRKRNASFCLDLIVWGIIALLPLIFFALSYLAYDLNSIENLPTFTEYFNSNFAVLNTNFIYTGFVDIFGSNGIMPLLDTTSVNSILLFMSYMVIVEIIHLAVDLLLMLPRLAHKFMHQIGGDD